MISQGNKFRDGIFVKENYHYKEIKPENIYIVEGLDSYLNIYTKEKRYTIYATMMSIVERFSIADFMRVHKSYIVRLDSISSFKGNLLTVGDKQIPIGRTYRRKVMGRFNIFT